MKRTRNRERPTQQKERSKARRSRDTSGSSAVSAAPVSPARKWLFRFLAVFLLPLIVLGSLEISLRLLGFGFDPHFFKREKIGGKDCYVANQDFGLRFFPRRLVRFPEPVVMPATKAPDTFRIFIFGESAALGDPRPNYGAGCYLEVLLAGRFPQAKFEVINTSMTAINSHAILPIAQECAGHAGDLWLIYMGNNEMVGPFGAATVFGGRAPPIGLVRAQLALERLRLGQALLALNRKFRKADAATSGWHGMEMFVQNQVAPNDPRRQRVHENFQRNLEGILKAGTASGVKILLSTVAINLKDCPPFGTVSDAELSATNRATYEKLCQDGAAAEAQGNLAKARSDYQQATDIFPQSAEAQFMLASCWLRLTNNSAARTHFLQAVDDDTLPFRADSKINDGIRKLALKCAGDSLVLCDAAESLAAASPDGIPGEELLYEHVHFNPNGNYALAVAWAGGVEKLLSPALKRGARPAWTSQAECEKLLGLTDWNRVSILEEILRRVHQPPFSSQSGNAQRAARLQDEINGLRKNLTNETALAQARETYLQALHRAPENFRVHENYAEFLEATHDLKSAIAERRKVCELIPQHYFPYYSLGMDLKESGALAEAREALLQAKVLKPDQGDVRLELGVVLARQGEWEMARQQLEAARQSSPDNPQPLLYLGEVLWKLERRGEAVTVLRDAIRLAPSDWQPHYRLASDLTQLGDLPEAAVEYQEALRLNPANVKTKLGLAIVLANLGRIPEALQQVDEALVLEPGNQQAFELRGKFQRR